MKGLEQYIESNAIYEELVNMQFTETQSVDEGLLDFFKKMSGKFSKAKNAVKATGTVLSDRIKKIYKDAYPEWWKEFERLTQLDDEKKRIEIINKITKLVDDTESKILSDEQKTAIKMILQKQQVDLSKAAGQADAQKQAEEQLKTLVKDNPEQAKEVTADLKKQGYEAPAAEGGEGEPAQSEETVNTATDNAKDAIETAGGDPDTVTAAVKKFLGLATESKIELPNILGIKGYISEGNQSEAAKKYFAADEDQDGKRLQALTTLLGAWQGLAKQLGVGCEKLTPLIQAILSNKEILTELNK